MEFARRIPNRKEAFMGNWIIIGVLVLFVCLAIFHIRDKKKKGTGCCGCSSQGLCSGNCGVEKERLKEK